MRSLWVSMNAAVYLYHNLNVIRIAGSISIPIKFLRCTHNCTFIYFKIQMNLLRNVFSFKSRWNSALYSTENTRRLIVLWSDIYYLMIRIIVVLSFLTSTLYIKKSMPCLIPTWHSHLICDRNSSVM